MVNENKSKKILLLYGLIGLGFLVFLGVMLITTLKSRHLPSLYTHKCAKSERGSIISADNFHIATTKKLYKAVVNNYYIDPQKEEHKLGKLAIFSGIWHFPSRVKCASLCWHTMKGALDKENTVSTE